MMQRPNNPGVGRRERKHAAEEKASQQTAGAGNPWEHDIDIVNLMGESGYPVSPRYLETVPSCDPPEGC